MKAGVVLGVLTACLLGFHGCAADAGGAAGPAPVFEGFSYDPPRAIEAGEQYTFTAKAHGAAGAAVRTEWQASGGVLAADVGPVTMWQAVKPGGQLKAGRARVEVRAVTPGGHVGGTVFLTIGDDGRASVDGFVANVYGDAAAATPAPTLTEPPLASPLPVATWAPVPRPAQDDAASASSAATGAAK